MSASLFADGSTLIDAVARTVDPACLLIFDVDGVLWASNRHWLYRIPGTPAGGIIGSFLDAWNLPLVAGRYSFETPHDGGEEVRRVLRRHGDTDTEAVRKLLVPPPKIVGVTWRHVGERLPVVAINSYGDHLAYGDLPKGSATFVNRDYLRLVERMAARDWKADLYWSQAEGDPCAAVYGRLRDARICASIMPVKT